ncbi:unnamed protein product [Ilex paraguariensis]|uniref:Wax synthase domain-containing protein n=1 Tax=Ilex paraguariensis TaxID=185542 RepID=A0ABC8T8L6_9AQUA
MEGELKNLVTVWLSIIACLSYCYFISAKIPKGKCRLFSLLPIFYLFTIFPLYLTSAFNTAVTAFFITWLANFKLLLFAFDLGPLSWDPPKSLPIFITIAALPIKIKQKRNYTSSQTTQKSPLNSEKSAEPTKKPTKLPLNLATESLAFTIFIGVLHNYKERIHEKLIFVVYCCLVFLLVDLLIAVSSALVRSLVGLELEAPSDEPYLSTSLQDFWGRRWNLIVTNTLRHTVYKPVRSLSAIFFGDNWAPLPAVLASFLVSGLMHELLFYYVTRASPSWETTSFFVLQGICVIAEFGLKKGLNERLRLPWFVSGPLTLGFVVSTSFWLFFPPLVKNGADVKVIEEFKFFVEYMKMNLEFPKLVGQ